MTSAIGSPRAPARSRCRHGRHLAGAV